MSTSLFGTALLSLLVIAAEPPLIEVPNAKQPAEGILTGGQPTQEQLREIAAAGYRTVINTRTLDEEGAWDETDFVMDLGMGFVQIPMDGAAGLTEENAELLAGYLAEPANYPVFIHCASGNRVGALLALKASIYDGATVEEALELGRSAGLTRLEEKTRAVLASKIAAAEAAASLPFVMPAPEGWRKETLVFPLEFAPGLDYRGLEELRFSPGMLDPESPQFWSYAFVWWLAPEADPDARELESALATYFRGLAATVAQAKGFDPGPIEVAARLTPGRATEGRRRYGGTVSAYDPFATRAPIELHVRIESWACSENEPPARVVFFQFSPRPATYTVWRELDAIRDGFRCSP